VWLDPGNSIIVATVRAWQGERLWSPRRGLSTKEVP